MTELKLQDAWTKRNKLLDESNKLVAEGDKLFAECKKLWAESDDCRALSCALRQQGLALEDNVQKTAFKGRMYYEVSNMIADQVEYFLIESDRLLAESKKLSVEGYDLYHNSVAEAWHEAGRLSTRGNDAWFDAVLQEFGDTNVVWEGKDCILPNGERYCKEES